MGCIGLAEKNEIPIQQKSPVGTSGAAIRLARKSGLMFSIDVD